MCVTDLLIFIRMPIFLQQILVVAKKMCAPKIEQVHDEVEGIQGASPQICIWGPCFPKSPDNDDYSPLPRPPLRVVASPPLD